MDMIQRFRAKVTEDLTEAVPALQPTRLLHETILPVGKRLWPAYVLASILILIGIDWALPNNPYQNQTFQADEGAAVWAVEHISFPTSGPGIYSWGTGLFYQVFLAKSFVQLIPGLEVNSLLIYLIGRIVVYLSALGAITMIFLIGRMLFDVETGRFAAIILAVTPGFVINSHYFKMDVPLAFWSLTSLFAAYKVMLSGRFTWVVALGLLTGYAASVKYSAAPLFVVGLVAIAMASARLNKRQATIVYLVCVPAGFLLGEPTALLKYSQIVQDLQTVARNSRIGIAYHLARPPSLIDYPLNVLPYSLTGALIITSTVGSIWAALTKGRILLPIWTYLLLSYLLLIGDNARFVRYTMPFIPIAALFSSYLFRSIRKLPGLNFAGKLATAAVILYAFLFSLSYVRTMAQTDPRIQASYWIESNIPRDMPIPVFTNHYLDIPQLQLMGYEKLELSEKPAELENAESQFLILSDIPILYYWEAIEFYPEVREFLQYVEDNYVGIAEFENSQSLLGIDSKTGNKLPHDWLHPNPKITIFKRQ